MSWPPSSHRFGDQGYGNVQDLESIAALRRTLKRWYHDLTNQPPTTPDDLLLGLQNLTSQATAKLAELLPQPPPPPPPPSRLDQLQESLSSFAASLCSLSSMAAQRFEDLVYTMGPRLGLTETPARVYARLVLCFAGAATVTGLVTYGLGSWLGSDDYDLPILGALLGGKTTTAAAEEKASKLAAEEAELESKRRAEAAERFFGRPNDPIARYFETGVKDSKQLEHCLHQMADEFCCDFDAVPPAALPGLKRAASSILLTAVPEEAQAQELSAEEARVLSERIMREAIRSFRA